VSERHFTDQSVRSRTPVYCCKCVIYINTNIIYNIIISCKCYLDSINVVFNDISIAIYNSFLMITHIIQMLPVEFLPIKIIFKDKCGVVSLLFRFFEFRNVTIRVQAFCSLLCKW
jgi:hypothetical protein